MQSLLCDESLADGGGSNSSRHYIFKEDLQRLVDEIGIEIRMAHYPPYISKYNPIEHRLFCHITSVCKGTVFSSIDVVKSLVDKTSTSKGLKVFSTITVVPNLLSSETNFLQMKV